MRRTNHDKTLMAVSPLFMQILLGSLAISLPMAYKFLSYGTNRTIGYFFVAGIYPEWPISVGTILYVPKGPQSHYITA